MTKYGCRSGLPHDLTTTIENGIVKCEVCKICGKKFRWNKGNKKRVENKKYLAAHARNFAQKGGATNRLYMKLYEPEKCVIKI